MKFSMFKQTWDGLNSENSFLRIIAFGQMVAVVGLAFTVAFRGETVILNPPEQTEQMTISSNKASDSYKRAWGLHVASMVGNLTPGNVDFVLGSLGHVLSPRVYEEFKVQAVRESSNLKKNGYSISFTPKSVIYEPETNKIYVPGLQRIESAVTMIRSNQPVTEQFTRTFEMIINIKNGKPSVLALTSYEGEPRMKRLLDRQLERNPNADAESAKVSTETKILEGLDQ